ncbi:MAG: FAD/NAD(P)-binding oxidoreductase [Myxococcota bacterium]|nr:FAD/NAD(P)-binding oxidoreductase [Myxococcota bacterium]
MSKLDRVVIAGASLAGLRAAESLRQLGFEGQLTLLGDEDAMPYDRPPLSKEVLRGDWEPEQTALVRDPARFEALQLDLRLGRRATALDTNAKRLSVDDDSHIDFDGLVVATGASPRRLPNPDKLGGVYTLRTLDEAIAIRSELEKSPRVAVVGAGFIGAEVAASCRARGLDVTMIEALPVPIERAVGRDIGEAVAQLHRDHSVDVRLGVGVEALEGGGRVGRVRLSDGSHVEADVVVVGIGVIPNIDWLEGSGLELGNGVVCDSRCATNVPGIVAAGDVAQWQNPLFSEAMRIEHWSNASEMARAAVETLLAREEETPEYSSVPFFWSDQYEIKIQSAGRLSDADASEVVSGSLDDRKFLKLYGKQGRLTGALSFNEPRKLIGYRRKLRKKTSFEDAVAEARGA